MERHHRFLGTKLGIILNMPKYSKMLWPAFIYSIMSFYNNLNSISDSSRMETWLGYVTNSPATQPVKK